MSPQISPTLEDKKETEQMQYTASLSFFLTKNLILVMALLYALSRL